MFYKANLYNYEELNDWVNNTSKEPQPEEREITWRQLGNDIYSKVPVDKIVGTLNTKKQE